MNSLNIQRFLNSLHPFERECLRIMKMSKLKQISTVELAQKSQALDLNKSNRAIDWLKEKGILTVSTEKKIQNQLTKSGDSVHNNGLPEKKLLQWLNSQTDAISISEIRNNSGLQKNEFNLALGLLRKKNLLNINQGRVSLTTKGIEEINQKYGFLKEQILAQIASSDFVSNEGNKNDLNDLTKRGLVEKKVIRTIITGILTEKGKVTIEQFDETEKYVDNLTSDLLLSGEWKNVSLRPYEVESAVPPLLAGKRHFYWQAIDYCRQIWLSLGFKEMEGSIVQTSFWNFDALFVPQDHPARDSQDTFFIKHPKSGRPDDTIYEKVAETHKNGGTSGSKGWGGNFSRETSASLALRTHTTPLSVQTIRKLREKGLPGKYFAIGRCFRNEKIDWNHLAEFDQVEGIVVDPDVTFQDLLGYLKVFFKAMGFPKARFRPAYYPYTEPSVAIDVFHPIKKSWFELGGSGIFRPEVVEPILGTDIPVLAWGPGIGRIIKENYNIIDIRRQYENDIDQLRKAPIWLR